MNAFRRDANNRLSTTRTVHGRDWIDGHLRIKAEQVLKELARVRVSSFCLNVSRAVSRQRHRHLKIVRLKIYTLGMRRLDSPFHGQVVYVL